LVVNAPHWEGGISACMKSRTPLTGKSNPRTPGGKSVRTCRR
jgi:hypothetical protein